MRIPKLIFVACLLHCFSIPVLQSSKLSDISAGKTDTIKIGLLINDNKSLAAVHGAELAIRQANVSGGCNGAPFSLLIRSMEGPWGTGSKETVSLIFDNEVWAIMGSHDGRNAHLAEQVTAKARVVFLSSWAADPTLSQAFVPWFFSCVPNNNQQSDILIEDIYNKQKFNRIILISENNYDADAALKSYVNKITIKYKPELTTFRYDNADENIAVLAENVSAENANCIILFGTPDASNKVIRIFREKGIKLPVYGILTLLDENKLTKDNYSVYEGITLVSSDQWFNKQGLDFLKEFQRSYGYQPGSVASYAYDGMNVIIESIKRADPDRDKVRIEMADIKYDGVTGIIQFDDKGNRKGPFHLMKIENGVPVQIR